MIRHLQIVAVASIVASTIPTNLAASECRGLTQDACSATPVCTWLAAIVKGTTSPRGATYKISRSAYCRRIAKRKPQGGNDG